MTDHERTMALAERNAQLAQNVVRLEKRLSIIEEVVQEQQDDPGIHHRATTVTESYLQTKLRELHAAVKGVKFEPRKPPITTGAN